MVAGETRGTPENAATIIVFRANGPSGVILPTSGSSALPRERVSLRGRARSSIDDVAVAVAPDGLVHQRAMAEQGPLGVLRNASSRGGESGPTA